MPLVNSGLARSLVVGRGVSVYYDQQAPYFWHEHRHGKLQIVISLDPVDGVATWLVGGEQHRHGIAGEFAWLVPANAPHAFDWQGTAGMVVLYVESEFVRDVCGRDLTAGAIADFSTLARYDLLAWRLAAEFRSLCRRQMVFTPALVESMGTLLAANVLRHFARLEDASAPSLPLPLLREVLDHIEANLSETISRTTLARLARLDVYSFARQFKFRTGMTPRDYIRRRRTVRALELIAEGKLKLAAIAGEVGFYDQSHLKRQLQRLRMEEADTARTALSADEVLALPADPQ
ncbi:MAG TPA: AraC family transcriptional regulator [Opitutaceae bacterium]|nr:AraC family transcriptional regulator [Opitutaceae bacterium]HRJ46261.1 AraC family transcriptional regulator [Opitutaceae bacterium]